MFFSALVATVQVASVDINIICIAFLGNPMHSIWSKHHLLPTNVYTINLLCTASSNYNALKSSLEMDIFCKATTNFHSYCCHCDSK